MIYANPKRKIYLASTIKLTSWRDEVIEKYSDSFNFIDSLKEEKKLGNVSPFALVTLDKTKIIESDFLVAYINEPSFGTSMELMYAWMFGIMIFIISENKNLWKDYWLSCHAVKFFISVDECFSFLEEFQNLFSRRQKNTLEFAMRDLCFKV